MQYKAVCEICTYVYATVGTETLRFPLQGEMFLSPDPVHEVPPPWPYPNFGWLEMKCPVCHNRPFVSDKWITIEVETTEDDLAALALTGHVGKVETTRKLALKGPETIKNLQVSVVDGTSFVDNIGNDMEGNGKTLPPGTVLLESEDMNVTVGDEPETPGGFGSMVFDKPVTGITVPAVGENEKPATLFPCPHCPKTFPNKQKLSGHVGGAHTPRKPRRKGKK